MSTTLKDIFSIFTSESFQKTQDIPTVQQITYSKKTSENGQEILELIKASFFSDSEIYLVFSKAIGDAVICSVYLDGIRLYVEKYKFKKKIFLHLAPHLKPLFETYCKKYQIEILDNDIYPTFETLEKKIIEEKQVNSLILEFVHHTGKPLLKKLENGNLVIYDLLGPSVGLYQADLHGDKRFSLFLADLLSIPATDLIQIKPRLDLPENYQQVLNNLYLKFDINEKNPQIAVIVEASVAEKRYPLENWANVLKDISKQFSDSQFNIFYNDDPDKGSYKSEQLIEAFKQVPNLHLISGTIPEQTILLSKQTLVLSNDTGFAHIAAILNPGPFVISLHLPQFPPKIWVTNQNRHFGFVLKSDQENINQLSPSEVARKSLEFLQTLRHN